MNRRFVSGTIAALLAVTVPSAVAVAAPAPPSAIATPTAGPAKPIPLSEPKITSEQAEAALRQLFTLPEQSDKLHFVWNLSGMNGKLTWDLEATIQQRNGSMGFSLAAVDAVTGRVLRYGGYDNFPAPVRTGLLTGARTEADAKAKAWELVQKLAPEKADVLRLAPAGSESQMLRYYGYDMQPDAYSFNWVEYHDGVPFPASSITVSVHKQSLDYVSLNVNLLDGVKFQAGPPKVPAADALKFWQAEVMPNLTYQQAENRFPMSRPAGYKLVYTFGNVGRPIDAMTGAWAQNFSYFSQPAAPGSATAEPEVVPAGTVSPVVPKALPLTAADARQFALAVLGVSDTADVRLGSGMDDDAPTLNFHLFDGESSSSVTLDAKTGLIRNAFRSTRNSKPAMPAPGGAEASKVTPAQEAQAKQAALAIVQTYYSQLREQLRLESAPAVFGPQANQLRRFRFVRTVNGLSVPNESVNVTIDLTTMAWRDISANWTSGIAFPSTAAAMAPEKVKEAAMAGREPMLIYRLVYPSVNRDQLGKGPLPQPTEAALAYVVTPDMPFQVDAQTGQPTPFGMPGITAVQAAYKAIEGHPAEGELQFVLSRGLLQPAELKPDAPLTRAQAVFLLLNRAQPEYYEPAATVPYNDVSDTDPVYGPVRMALAEGWLQPDAEKSFRPNSAVTRAEFAVWAARALGLGDLALSALKVEPGYKDLTGLTAEQRKAAAFLQAMGLLPAGEMFRGQDPLTQAEGAALMVRIHNYLLTR